VTLGLWNGYYKHVMREPHRRAISRAGAVAAAFEANLALFGFPLPEDVRTPEQLARWAGERTTIGQDAAYFIELAGAGRVGLFAYPEGGFPPQLGTPVATTPSPRAGHAVALSGLASRVGAGESVLLVFGLGPHGLPKAVHGACADDFDVSGRGYSLETATAMGAVTAAIWYATKTATQG
jgi:hypothetical protein